MKTIFFDAENRPAWFKDSPYGDTSGHVGKYDELFVWQRPDGMRWSAHLKEWVTEESNNGTSFLGALVTKQFDDRLEAVEIDELADYIDRFGPLPEGGVLIDINES